MAKISQMPIKTVTNSWEPEKSQSPNTEQDELAFNAETEFMIKNIQCRECDCFVVRSDQDPSFDEEKICHCSYPEKDHPKTAFENKSKEEKWEPLKHTKAKPTDAFGEIEFVGFGDRVGKYVRVDVDTSMDTMLDLLTKVWKMEMPNLLISVTGGAKNFTMKSRLKEVFRRGLVKAALSTGAWIVTGGTHAGVMKHVGEAVRDFGLTSEGRVTTIGIATWGCVQNKEHLIKKKASDSNPVMYRIENEAKPKQSFLDPNHSHYILVDNGTQHQFTVEIPFRAKLEQKISEQKTDKGTDDGIKVPVCLLVLEGGPGTLETVISAIQSKTPTVVIKGSGKIADILAFAYQNSKEEEIVTDRVKSVVVKMEAHIEAGIKNMIQVSFGNDQLDKRVQWVKECCNNRDLLSVFELDSKNSAKDVDLAILKALFKVSKNQAIHQLKLALAWNRIDVAKSEIFTDERTWPTGILDEVMMSAIKLNRVEFVELFLDNGVSLKNFLTIKRLISLYNTIPQHCLLYLLLLKTKKKYGTYSETKVEFSLVDVGHLLQDLLGDFYQPHYLTDCQLNNINVTEMSDIKGHHKGSTLSCKLDYTEAEYIFNSPAQELFIWAVLMNYHKLSKLFWRDGKQSSTAACLFAHCILNSLKAHTIDAKMIKKLQTAADDYQEIAIGVISNCYSSDEARTHDLLIQHMPHWGQTSCIHIAARSNNQLFIAQSACQSLLTKVWMGSMSQSNSFLMILASIIVFFLVPWFIKFNKVESKVRKISVSNKETKLPNGGINRQPTELSNSVKTALAEKKFESNVTLLNKLIWFYSSPMVKFAMNVLTYLSFLIIYSYVLVVELASEFHFLEGILITWVFTLFMEEIREFLSGYANSLKSKLITYLENRWNILDIFCIFLFTLGFILRFIPCDDTLTAARVILSINLIAFFSRILHIFSINKQLGPKLVMIGKMLQDLKWFVVILLVFVVSYALASEAVLYPNTEPSWKLLFYIPRKAYWQIYGELFLDDIEANSDCTDNATLYRDYSQNRCPSEVGKYFVPILLGCYMLMTNVLLLNLLIAMFTYTFEQVQENTDMHWCFQRFKLVIEYTMRPVLPPPLILFSHLYLFVSWIIYKRQPINQIQSHAFNKIFENKEEERQLMQWEDLIADNFLDSREKVERNSVEGKVKATLERLDQVLSKVDELQDSMNQTSGANNTEAQTTQSTLEKRVEILENQLTQTTKALNWIMTSLQEHNLASKQKRPTL